VDNERNNLEIVGMILKLLNKPDDMFEFVEDRPGNDLRYAIEMKKLKELGWQPEYTWDHFEVGMSETINWYLNNKKWVDDLKRKHKEAYNINHTPTREKKKQEEDKFREI